jgi:glycosyltransferase involved in cell wall biosynthesis
MEYRASIVIPAHNEESRIRSLLQSLTDPSLNGGYAIFVILNGCTDRTREVAEEFEGVKVVEIEQVGKHFALNAGDRLAGDIFPRLYCDADIRIDPGSVEHMVQQLTSDRSVAAGPTVKYDVSQCSWGIKKYHQALECPIVSKWSDAYLMGRGVYGSSRAARKKFDAFPPLLADDKFFDAQYDSTEKAVLPGTSVTIVAPVNLRELIRGEARVVQGNRDLANYMRAAHLTSGEGTATAPSNIHHQSRKIKTLRQWMSDIRPSDCVPLIVYLIVKVTSRIYIATLTLRQRQISWR